MNDQVAKAVEQIRSSFPGKDVVVRDDGEGGAYVLVEGVELDARYSQDVTWAGARITFQYPYADVYPLYVRGDLTRRDGQTLGEGAAVGQTFEGRAAVQLSRRSNRLNPARDTAAMKLQKVLVWLNAK